MDIRKPEYIVAIADEGSVTRAAEKLFLTRPALSHYLLTLEESLGSPIFRRTRTDPHRRRRNLYTRRQTGPGYRSPDAKGAGRSGGLCRRYSAYRHHPGQRRRYVQPHLPQVPQKISGL